MAYQGCYVYGYAGGLFGWRVVDRIDGSWMWIEIGSCDDKVVYEAQCMGVRTDLTLAPEIGVLVVVSVEKLF